MMRSGGTSGFGATLSFVCAGLEPSFIDQSSIIHHPSIIHPLSITYRSIVDQSSSIHHLSSFIHHQSIIDDDPSLSIIIDHHSSTNQPIINQPISTPYSLDRSDQQRTCNHALVQHLTTLKVTWSVGRVPSCTEYLLSILIGRLSLVDIRHSNPNLLLLFFSTLFSRLSRRVRVSGVPVGRSYSNVSHTSPPFLHQIPPTLNLISTNLLHPHQHFTPHTSHSANFIHPPGTSLIVGYIAAAIRSPADPQASASASLPIDARRIATV